MNVKIKNRIIDMQHLIYIGVYQSAWLICRFQLSPSSRVHKDILHEGEN